MMHGTAPRLASALILGTASGCYFYGRHTLKKQEDEKEAACAELFRYKIREQLRDLNERKVTYDKEILSRTAAMGRNMSSTMQLQPNSTSHIVKTINGNHNESELQRQVQESDRVEAETERVENELERINSGLAMIQEENKRLASEVDRQTAERGRVAAELERADNEIARIQEREGIRESEQQRMAHEQLRQTREVERVQAELRRMEQESSREKRMRGCLKKTSLDTQLLLHDLRGMVHQDHQAVSDQMNASAEGLEHLLESLSKQQRKQQKKQRSSLSAAKGTNLQQLMKEHKEQAPKGPTASGPQPWPP